MSTFFLLIPGARLPSASARVVLDSLSAAERSAFAAIGEGGAEPVMQRIAAAPFERAPHRSWLWRVLGRTEPRPEEAPYRWLESGGPDQSVDLWSLSALALTDGRVAAVDPELDDRTFLTFSMRLARIVEAHGMRLQTSRNHWYVTRREPWIASAAPAESLLGAQLAAAPLGGKDAGALRALCEALAHETAAHPELVEANAVRRAAGLPALDAFWIHGGGRTMRFPHPTEIRSVAADDPVVRGWANAAGILSQRISPLNGAWPEAPEGDLLALVEDLYGPWLAGDLAAWRRALPRTAERVASLREQAGARRTEETLTVLFGHGTSASIAPAKKGLLSLLKRPAPVAPEAWLADEETDR